MAHVYIDLEEYKELLRYAHEAESVSRYVATEKYPSLKTILGIMRIPVPEQEA
jgi:hypothetical protein